MKLFLLLTLSLSLGCALGDKADDGDVTDVEDVSDEETGEEDDEDEEDEEEEEATTGPGVLGDETGLEAMCRRFFECGGALYENEEECIQASYDYWGECSAVVDALDALGACVADVECSEYNPDSYHPGAIGCGDEFEELGASDCR